MLLLNLVFIPIMGTVYREEVLSFVNSVLDYYSDDVDMDDSELTVMLTVVWIITAISTGV